MNRELEIIHRLQKSDNTSVRYGLEDIMDEEEYEEFKSIDPGSIPDEELFEWKRRYKENGFEQKTQNKFVTGSSNDALKDYMKPCKHHCQKREWAITHLNTKGKIHILSHIISLFCC